MRPARALRHFLAVAVLPVTVAGLVPLWIAQRYAVVPAIGASVGLLVLQAAGLIVLALGGLLFVSSLRRFAGEGQGTLAPWDPPRRLVVRGPYRFVRNPMISGVLFALVGEAMLLASRPHVVWSLVFLGVNVVYIPLVEEPGLRRRFGAAHLEYCRHVPRVFPRMHPWSPASAHEDAA